ncbi:MAG TPA: efflux transporter periplasmic adaptor subunit [Janthinobacterium sp.]|nr:efflux transporter periplasmic adaptor subunit [Janthinobacterium sp.]
MKNTTKHRLAIAAILVAGALLAALILGAKPAMPTTPATPTAPATATAPPPATATHQEGKIILDQARITAAGVTLARAAAGRIETRVSLPGEIRYNEDRTAHVVPRVAGVVESVRADLGQHVKRGQVLAVVASGALSELRSEWLAAHKRAALARATYARERSLWQEKISAEQDYLQAAQALAEADIAVQNAAQKLAALGVGASVALTASGSLNRYEIRAPFDGTVLEKHIAPGEALREDSAIFTISDLSTVWAEIAVPAKDLAAVRVGAPATVRASAFDASAGGAITFVGALIGAQTRTATARVVLANPALAWRPGLFVNVDVVAGAAQAPVAVAAEAIQDLEGQASVFLRVADGFQAQAVTLGRGDGKLVEIVKGLPAGAHYAAGGSFTLKSELGKDGADHEH